MFNLTKSFSERRKSVQSGHTYSTLENRCLLAVTPTFSGGVLNIAITEAGETAVLSSTAGDLEVLVNGEMIDLDLKMDGLQAATIADITDIVIAGDDDLDDLFVQLDGSFADGTLNSLSLNNINEVLLNGLYTPSSFNGTFVGDDGSLSGPGRIVVGDFQVTSESNFSVTLNNPSNDFVGGVSITTDANVDLFDSNSILLQDIDVNNLMVTANGGITDGKGSSLVAERTTFLGTDINLGNNGSPVDFVTVSALSPGNLSINDANSLTLAGFSDVDSADITVGQTLSQGPQANSNVNGDLAVVGDIVRLGVGGGNEFNTGRINLNVTSNAFIWENSGLELFGGNSGPAFDLIATGDITNSADTSINVNGITSVQSTTSVSLGTADGDTFNTNSFEFFAPIVEVSEDSNTSITGLANFAGNLSIESNGSITNSDVAFIFVQNNASFTSALNDGQDLASVEIGTGEDDFFSAGTVTFNVANGNFTLSEDDATLIASENFANAISVTSPLDITNGPQSVIDVTTNAFFNATNVDIGESLEDSVQFGSITFATTGDVFLRQDSDVLFTGTSDIGGQLLVVSSGAIADSTTSMLSVGTLTSFFGSQGVTIGETVSDTFTTQSLRFGTAQDVSITHDGDIQLAAGLDNNATNVELTALATADADGDISNLDGSELIVFDNLILAADGDVSLGTAMDDLIIFDNLNFNTSGLVEIETDFTDVEDDLLLFGSNTASELRLTTNVDVVDGTNATTVIEDAIRIEARNITLGDSDTDCLSLPDAANQDFLTSDMAPSIEEDANC